jgi:hypothetical protein
VRSVTTFPYIYIYIYIYMNNHRSDDGGSAHP